MKKLPFIYLLLSFLFMFSEYTGENIDVMILYYTFWGANCFWAIVLTNRELEKLDKESEV